MKYRKDKSVYTSEDGRFEIYPMTGITCAKWQARAIDGTKPFRYKLFGKVRFSEVYNADTLRECKEEIELIA